MKTTGINKAFAISMALHLAGAVAVLWMGSGSPEEPLPETRPIQIKAIVYESSLEQKMEKVAASAIIPAEENFTKANAVKPVSARPRQEIKPAQPIATVMASAFKRTGFLSNNSPRPVEPLAVQPAKPVFYQSGISANRVRQPYASVQSLQVAELVSAPARSIPATVQTGRAANKVRHFSKQPVRMLERVILSNNSMQMVSKVSRRFDVPSKPELNIRARNISHENNLLPFPGKSNREVLRQIGTNFTNQIQPVQLASMPAGFVEASHDEELAARLGTSPASGQPEEAIDSSGEDLGSLRKGFSSSVWGRIAKAKYYPSIARKRGWEGKPVIEFQVGKNGDLLDSSIALVSPYEILDQAALDVVRNASPYPKIPEPLQLNSIIFKLPVSFILEEP